jgi:hypothetical protein
MSWKRLMRQADRLNALGTLYNHGAIGEPEMLKLRAAAVADARAVFAGPPRSFVACMAGRCERFDLLDEHGQARQEEVLGLANWCGWSMDAQAREAALYIAGWTTKADVGESAYFGPAGYGGVCLVCVPASGE